MTLNREGGCAPPEIQRSARQAPGKAWAWGAVLQLAVRRTQVDAADRPAVWPAASSSVPGRRFSATGPFPAGQGFVGLMRFREESGCGCWGSKPGQSPVTEAGRAATLTASAQSLPLSTATLHRGQGRRCRCSHRPGKNAIGRLLEAELLAARDDLYTGLRRS